MRAATDWKDYEVVATGDGYKLERWKDVFLLRPDPQVIWPAAFDFKTYPKLNAYYERSETGGGRWHVLKKMPDEWNISYRDLKFTVRPMGFKHTGLFPEQAVNWDRMRELVRKRLDSGRQVSVLNLFAYTGGATAALAREGASVCHVDAAKNMVERAGNNVRLSGVPEGRVRYIVDDCFKFVRREIRRGNKYDAIIMDPPSYGRGPNGETWKIESGLFGLVELCRGVLSDDPLFFLINSYTTGLQPQVLKNVLTLALKDIPGKCEAYEVGLPTKEEIVLPCGAGGMFFHDD